MAEKLHSIFSYRFEFNIWRFLLDKECNSLAVELRSPKELKVQLAICNLGNNKAQILKINELDWWTTLDSYDGQELYLKKYDEDSNPTVKNIIRYNLTNSQVSIINPENYLSKESYKSQSPSLYPSVNEHNQILANFITKSCGDLPDKQGIEYLEHENFVILSYYIGKSKMANFLLVCDMDGNVLLHERMDENLEGIGQDTFTIANNKIIFVKDKKELKTYQLK